MKKILLLVMLLSAMSAIAQDVIVKRDGSTILSKVIEIGTSDVKFKKSSNQDGPTYTILKKEIQAINYENGEKDYFKTETIEAQKYIYSNVPQPGLKGFIEGGYTFGMGFYGERRIALQALFGYQFNQYLFMGVGVGENYYCKSELYGIPLFADLRMNILNYSISPFIDAKIGYSICDVEGFFFSPSIGCRIGLSNNTAFTFSVGYEMQKADCFTAGYVLGYGSFYEESKENVGGLTLKIGFEF